MESAGEPPLDGPARALRAALRGDCHTHTDASDGGSPLREMARTARELGHDYVVITDPLPAPAGRQRAVRGAAARADRADRRTQRRAGRGVPVRMAVEAGCEFTIDTDAHAPGQLDWLGTGCARATECEVPTDRVRNTWPAQRVLRRWTGIPDEVVLDQVGGRDRADARRWCMMSFDLRPTACCVEIR